MPSNGGMQSKISLKENSAVSFNSHDNANTFCRFFWKLADSLLQKLSRSKNKFGRKTTAQYYKHIRNECFVLYNVDVTTVDKILKNLDVTKVSGIDQIFAKFLKDGAPVIAIHLANIISVTIKLDNFSIEI